MTNKDSNIIVYLILSFLVLFAIVFLYAVIKVENNQDLFCIEKGWEKMCQDQMKCCKYVIDKSGLGVNEIKSGYITDEYFKWLGNEK